jgi:CDP-alcohol phosphatidyltransferase
LADPGPTDTAPAPEARLGFKPRDVEEAIDFYLHRPLAGRLVRVVAGWPVSPNQLTLASGFASMLAGTAIYLAAWRWPSMTLAGSVLLFASVVLDCADGQLARIKGITSVFGRALDGLVDSVAPLSVMPAMLVLLLANGATHLSVWTAGWAAGLSLLSHANTYDVTKNLYLHAIRPDFDLGGSTLFLPEQMQRLHDEMLADGRRGAAFMMKVWIAWTKPQLERIRPWGLPTRTPQNEPERELYRRHFRPIMRVTTWLGFGTHLCILYVTAALATWWPASVWVGWGVIAGPLNLLAVWVRIRRPRAERAFLRELAELRAG